MAVELWVTVPPVADKLLSGVVPPTAPVKVIVAVPAAKVSACAPFKVVLKVMFPLLAELVIVLVPVKLTGLGKVRGFVPVTVILLPIWISPAVVKLRFVSGVVPPTAPVKVTVPVPAVKVKACAPFKVLLKLMFPLFAELVIVLVPVKLTGLEKVSGFAPVTVMLAPTEMLAALVKVMFVRGVVPPTAPLKLTTPPVPACRVKEVFPLMVLVKEILAPAAVPPAFVVSNVGAAVIATGPVMVITPPLVVKLVPLILMTVLPV